MFICSYFENEFSKSVTVKQRSKYPYSGLRRSSARGNNFNTRSPNTDTYAALSGKLISTSP